jgi:pyruvate,water dikinase
MNFLVAIGLDLRVSGTLSTADPQTGRRDLIHIHPREAEESLSPADLERLRSMARDCEKAIGHPLHLHWVHDREGRFQWVGAWPLLSLPEDPGSCDAMQSATDAYGRIAVYAGGERALTPLSISTLWRALDRSLGRFQEKLGGHRRTEDGFSLLAFRFGHPLVNLSRLASLSASTLGLSSQRLVRAFSGAEFPGLPATPPKSWLVRLKGFFHLVTLILAGRSLGRRMELLVDEVSLPNLEAPLSQWYAIDKRLPELGRAIHRHASRVHACALLEAFVLDFLGAPKSPGIPSSATLSMLLCEEPLGENEGVDLAEAVDGLARLLCALPDEGARFRDSEPQEAIDWLRTVERGNILASFQELLKRHGHRGPGDFELRESEWIADGKPLIAAVQAACRAHGGKRISGDGSWRPAHDGLAFDAPLWIQPFVALLKTVVARKGRSASQLAMIVRRYRAAYRQLGLRLAAEKLLPDADGVFFLSHDELGRLCRGEEDFSARAGLRRSSTRFQARAELPAVSSSWPEPLADAPEGARPETPRLHGRVVSGAMARGPVRIARHPMEAGTLKPGEILVTPSMGMGWVPFLPAVSGWVSESGSLSDEAAVVARARGIPCLTGVDRATRWLRTGDRVALDGMKGCLDLEGGPGNSGRR